MAVSLYLSSGKWPRNLERPEIRRQTVRLSILSGGWVPLSDRALPSPCVRQIVQLALKVVF